jgi:hypothetical protein
LGREQLSNFDPRPFGEALEEEFRIARMQFETRDQTPARAVRFARRSAFATATCNLSETSIVGSHKTKDWADPILENGGTNSAFSPDLNGRDATPK